MTSQHAELQRIRVRNGHVQQSPGPQRPSSPLQHAAGIAEQLGGMLQEHGVVGAPWQLAGWPADLPESPAEERPQRVQRVRGLVGRIDLCSPGHRLAREVSASQAVVEPALSRAVLTHEVADDRRVEALDGEERGQAGVVLVLSARVSREVAGEARRDVDMGAERTAPDGESLLAEQLLPARGSAGAAGHDFERSRSAALQDLLD